MTYVTMARYAPGKVTPEQLAEYRKKYEAARQKQRAAGLRYEETYFAYADALKECLEARDIYEWAQHGMVLEPTTPTDEEKASA